MQIIEVEQNTEEWMEQRRAKVMGSIAQDVIPKEPLKGETEKALTAGGMNFIQLQDGLPLTADVLRKLLTTEQRLELGQHEDRKVGFYQLVAEMIGIPPDDENVMERGHRLEDEARQKLSEHIGKKVQAVGICTRDDEPRIANSPDGLIKVRGKWAAAAEIKCLRSAHHIQSLVEKKIPADYWSQAMQYFVVNDDLKTLYFTFYDPRVTLKPFHVIELHREDVAETVEHLVAYQKDTLVQAEKIIEGLMFS